MYARTPYYRSAPNPILIHTINTYGVPNYSYRVSSCQSGQTHGETCTQMHETTRSTFSIRRKEERVRQYAYSNNEYLAGGGFTSPAIKTEMTREYTAMIPAITTGISDCNNQYQLLGLQRKRGTSTDLHDQVRPECSNSRYPYS